MSRIDQLFEKNKKWANKVISKKPDFFQSRLQQKNCKLMWFGCCDSRVPETQILGMGPGDVFVHRNIGNQVNHEDLSSMVALKVAVEVQQVSDIVVCGHTRCLSIGMAIEKSDDPLYDKWLQPVRDLYEREKNRQFESTAQSNNFQQQCDTLSRINVEQQVKQIARNAVIQKAWENNKDIAVHGFMYDVGTGLIEDLQISVFAKK